MATDPRFRSGTTHAVMRTETPRSLHHKNHRRTTFGERVEPADVPRLDGHPRRGEEPREGKDPSSRLRDRRDEHVPPGEVTPHTKRRDSVAHWERANAVDRRRHRGDE